ncbi:MAG: hypothetical protein H6668_07615 [Ardenticatenaceae bacterium]|nr:hypothetical protein [Ardenticatenaceae bacterium]
MMRHGKKTGWQQLDEKAGFDHDERTERVQQVGVRRVYWLTAVLVPIVAAWQQMSYKTGGIGVIITAVLLTLLYLLWQHHRLAPVDERTALLLNRSYRHAYLFLLLTVMGQLTILFWRSNGMLPGLFLWPPTILLTLLPLFATHIQQRSYPARTWQIIALIGFISLLAAFWLGTLHGRATP